MGINEENVDVVIVSTVEPFAGLDMSVVSWRSGKIYEFLKQNDVNVRVVTSTFNHYTKSFRRRRRNDDYVLLRSIGYKSNMSLLRFLNYCIHVPQIFLYILKVRPKIVLITLPPVVHLLAIFLVKLFQPNIKFWVDVRDLWPEIFVERFTKIFTKTGAGILFWGSFKLRHTSLNAADFVTTISPVFSKILHNNEPILVDKIKWFPHPKVVVPLEKVDVTKNRQKIRFVYIGSLSERTDLVNFVSDLATYIGKNRCEFIVGGQGVLVNSINALKNEGIDLTYLGWVPGDKVNDILKEADFGMIPYPATLDFDSSFPNKYLEYCALGMRSVSRPLSIYKHNDVPIEIRPFVMNEEFSNIALTKLTLKERQQRQKIFSSSLSDLKMREYINCKILDLFDNKLNFKG